MAAHSTTDAHGSQCAGTPKGQAHDLVSSDVYEPEEVNRLASPSSISLELRQRTLGTNLSGAQKRCMLLYRARAGMELSIAMTASWPKRSVANSSKLSSACMRPTSSVDLCFGHNIRDADSSKNHEERMTACFNQC